FKHPEPADFFRTMEDASGVDLDWFWRGWFYDIDPVDISIDTVKAYSIVHGQKVSVKNDTVYTYPKMKEFDYISRIRNRESGMISLVDKDTTLRDFYYHYKPEPVIYKEVKNRNENLEEIPAADFAQHNNKFIY